MRNICSIEQLCFLIYAFFSDHLFSIGLRSGEYGGKNSIMCPALVIIFNISVFLWKVALSITITVTVFKLGSRKYFTQVVNTTVSILQVNNPIANKTLSIKAPMTLVRPLAPQSQTP